MDVSMNEQTNVLRLENIFLFWCMWFMGCWGR